MLIDFFRSSSRRAAGAGGFVEAAEDGLRVGCSSLRRSSSTTFCDFRDGGAGGFFGFGGEDVFEGEECGDGRRARRAGGVRVRKAFA